jgi:hypothetical protein
MEKTFTMAKIRIFLFIVLLFSSFNCKRVSENDLTKDLAATDTDLTEFVKNDIVEVIPAEESFLEIPEVLEAPVKMTLEEIYLSQIGVREATGKNDGPEVEMYLHSVGKSKGLAWCSAFVAWCLNEAEIKHTVNAWSPTSENRRNFVYRNQSFFKQPLPGDVFTIFYPRLKRIGHTGFYHANQNESIIITVEGNTNEAGSREGDGVYKKYRSLRTIHSISRWP